MHDDSSVTPAKIDGYSEVVTPFGLAWRLRHIGRSKR